MVVDITGVGVGQQKSTKGSVVSEETYVEWLDLGSSMKKENWKRSKRKRRK